MIVARDIMSEHVIVIYKDMLISQVAHLMLRDRVSAFPVIDKKIGVTGIITMTDLFRIIHQASGERKQKEFYKKISYFKELTVGDVMSQNLVTIKPKTTLSEIIHLLVIKGIHTFPVIEDGKLVGIVSRHDILNALFSI